MRQFKYLLAVAITVVFAVSASTGQAADVRINIGYAAPEKSSYGVLAAKFEELAEKYSNGSIDVKVRCCTQLATEDEAFKAMQIGTVDMFIITHNNISPHFPLMEAFVLPYVFQSTEHAYKVMDGPIGAEFAGKLEKDTDVHLLTYGYVEYRDFYNSVRPINSIADMKGLKVRTPKNKVMIETHNAFGSSPIPIPWSETLTALQTGAVAGGDSGASFVKSQKFYEIADNLAVLEHFAFFTPLFASQRIMGKLSSEQQDAVRRAATEAGQYQREEMARQLAVARDFLRDKGGMKVTFPDKADFIKAGITVQDNFISEKGDADLKELLLKIRAAAKG